MIALSHLTKRFGSATVLNNLTLTFQPGTATAIIGPNGSGKTTFMKCILGLVTPTSGAISIDGVNAINNAESRSNLGYMSQIARYPDNLTPTDIINMVKGLRPRGTATSEAELIDLFDLHPHMLKPMRALSGGSRQKVSAVIAMIFQPKVLLLDEPTAGLDPIAAGSLKARISSMTEAGATILVTSHILSDIEELASRIVVLHEGNIIYDGATLELLSRTRESTLERAIAMVMSPGGLS